MILVISDTHFGNEPTGDARETTVGMERLLTFIEERKPEKMILLGDIFDFYRCDVVDAIESSKRKFFLRLDEMMKGFPCHIVYIVGNHDHFFRLKEYNDRTYERILNGEGVGEIDSSLIVCQEIPSAKRMLQVLLPHAGIVEAKYPFHTETISGKTFFFEHGDYTDYLFFYGGGWEYYFYPFLKKKEAKTDILHIMEYLESLASIRNTASYYQKIEEHLHATLESIQRNVTVTERKRLCARIFLSFLFLSIFLLLPLSFWLYGVFDVVLITYFSGLVIFFLAYLFFKEKFVQKAFGFLLRLFIEAFGPTRGESVEKLFGRRLSSKMFRLEGRKDYIDLLSLRAGCRIDFYVFGHTHYAGQIARRSLTMMNAGCWSVPNGEEANRLVEKYRKAKDKKEIEERLYALAENIGDWRKAKTLLVIESNSVSLLSLHDGETKFSKTF